MAAEKNEILPDRARNEGDAVGVGELVVFLDVGVAANQPARHGPLVDAELEHHPDVQCGEGEQHSGNDEDMEGEEAGQRGAVDDRAAQHQVHQRAADQRHAAHDGCADAEAPVSVLVEAQHLAGEGHAQGHQKHEDARGSR